MFESRSCQQRACRKDESAEPPPERMSIARSGFQLPTTLFTLAVLMLPQLTWAAGAVYRLQTLRQHQLHLAWHY